MKPRSHIAVSEPEAGERQVAPHEGAGQRAQLAVHARITRAPVDVAELSRWVQSPACGAVASFVGVVRADSDGQPVLRLDYEAYEPMAERELRRVASRVQARHSLNAVAIEHRVGSLDVGEVAVAVVVASPHRRQALDACAEAIEMVKRDVPIWKREHHPGGARWVDCTEPGTGDGAAHAR